VEVHVQLITFPKIYIYIYIYVTSDKEVTVCFSQNCQSKNCHITKYHEVSSFYNRGIKSPFYTVISRITVNRKEDQKH